MQFAEAQTGTDEAAKRGGMLCGGPEPEAPAKGGRGGGLVKCSG